MIKQALGYLLLVLAIVPIAYVFGFVLLMIFGVLAYFIASLVR